MYKKNRNIIQFTYDIEECINEVIEEVNGIEYVEFAADKKLIGYVERQLEKIGEAITQIQKLDKNILLQSYNEISYWENIKGMRNRLIHEYWGTSIEMVYEVSLYELEELLEYIKQVRNNVINTN
ncbi:HepT-like ribonuclease domain-containing protein [Leptotrichia massiliensis]|uniref:HepT-like ribonuclease domain-containing protein n=1 Tax=Leptotrichia massiliensis TaxID=1852388 RepID=UPI0008DA8D8F|nr:HepT-like ribonuclease domain-containing protein [Leptotrichia massiliensis]